MHACMHCCENGWSLLYVMFKIRWSFIQEACFTWDIYIYMKLSLEFYGELFIYMYIELYIALHCMWEEEKKRRNYICIDTNHVIVWQQVDC